MDSYGPGLKLHCKCGHSALALSEKENFDSYSLPYSFYFMHFVKKKTQARKLLLVESKSNWD